VILANIGGVSPVRFIVWRLGERVFEHGFSSCYQFISCNVKFIVGESRQGKGLCCKSQGCCRMCCNLCSGCVRGRIFAYRSSRVVSRAIIFSNLQPQYPSPICSCMCSFSGQHDEDRQGNRSSWCANTRAACSGMLRAQHEQQQM
jgi:hypothetical protein